MRFPIARLAAACLFAAALAPAARAADGDTLTMKHDPEKYRVVVTATKTTRARLDVAGSADVVSGAELRRTGARTLADALINVPGLDTGDGSDNGARFPNIGVWGLKEFDALLVTVDGVPVGGPFNPSLSQIPVEDIERIEILKGPQGSLYGVSAFAGAIHVITRGAQGAANSITLGGGTFGALNGDATWSGQLADGTALRASLASSRDDGWQDRAGSSLDRGTLKLSRAFGERKLSLDLQAYRDDQRWGTPLPYDAGEVLPNFVLDRNYAVLGAHVEHRVLSAALRAESPAPWASRLENTFGVTHDRQTFLRSFFMDFPTADTVGSEGVKLEPTETTVFDDLRWIAPFQAAGSHELVTGASLTFGSTKGDGRGFDFDQSLTNYPSMPGAESVPVGDTRDFEDERTFLGLYAHDEWTPHARVTVSGGGRFDATNESLEVGMTEGGLESEGATDEKSTQAWSGDLGAVLRLAPSNVPALGALNLFGNWKSSFKPAAPNLTEAEAAEILDPERTHSLEGGLKASALDDQLGLEASIFQMDFHNMVVSNLGPGGSIELLNAGHERFKGWELSLNAAPAAIPGLTLDYGFSHHDARFVQFTFVTPDSQMRDVAGKRLELVPAWLWNAGFSYRARCGAGVWAAFRHQNERPLNRRNRFWTPGYDEWDAGASWDHGPLRVAVVGRNLGDDRHPVSESDIGDSQFYVSAPRRVTGSVTVRY